MPDLKTDHPALYKRVRVKAVVHMLIGLDLLIYPGRTPSLIEAPVLSQLFDLRIFGAIFVTLGLTIIVAMFKKKKTYLFARYAIFTSAFYCLAWALALVYLAIFTPRTVPIAILWSYWVNNLFVVSLDPGWKAISYLNKVREDADV